MVSVEMNRAKVLTRLTQEGWVLARHGAEHDVYTRPGQPGVVSLPRHRTLSPGVARSIAKSAGWR